MILYINACVRKNSRTRLLAEYLLSKMDDEIVEIKVHDLEYPKMDEDFINLRNAAGAQKNYDAPCAALSRQFTQADTIVVAAPFWDLSFPSALKDYFEQVCIVGISFDYDEEGLPYGLCKARKLYYVTTAGGLVDSYDYGFGYIRALATDFYHIPEIKLIKAENLDVDADHLDQILEQAKADIDALFQEEICQ